MPLFKGILSRQIYIKIIHGLPTFTVINLIFDHKKSHLNKSNGSVYMAHPIIGTSLFLPH
jgi:hypothetical protein